MVKRGLERAQFDVPSFAPLSLCSPMCLLLALRDAFVGLRIFEMHVTSSYVAPEYERRPVLPYLLATGKAHHLIVLELLP